MSTWLEGLRDRWAGNLPSNNHLLQGGTVAMGLLALVVLGMQRSQPAPSPVQVSGLVQTEGPKAAAPVVVHVLGAVLKPGVQHLPAGSRVEDAIKAAGGAKPNADLEALNLAAVIDDGSQLYIPAKVAAPPKGKKVLPPPPAPKAASPKYQTRAAVAPSYASKPAPESPAASGGLVSINTGSIAELDTLPGIGPATAKKIIEYRKTKGLFRSIEQLLDVKGIGPKKLADLRNKVRL